MRVVFNTYIQKKQNTVQYFEQIVLPLWYRYQRDISSDELCCATVVMLNHVPDWLAEETGESIKDIRKRFVEMDPMFEHLDVVARALKHRELDRNPDKGLKDVLREGIPPKDGNKARATAFGRMGTLVQGDEMLRTCVEIFARELDVALIE